MFGFSLAKLETGEVDVAMNEVMEVLRWGITILLAIAALVFVYFVIVKAIGLASASSEDERKKQIKSLIFVIIGAFLCGIAASIMPLIFDLAQSTIT